MKQALYLISPGTVWRESSEDFSDLLCQWEQNPLVPCQPCCLSRKHLTPNPTEQLTHWLQHRLVKITFGPSLQGAHQCQLCPGLCLPPASSLLANLLERRPSQVQTPDPSLQAWRRWPSTIWAHLGLSSQPTSRPPTGITPTLTPLPTARPPGVSLPVQPPEGPPLCSGLQSIARAPSPASRTVWHPPNLASCHSLRPGLHAHGASTGQGILGSHLLTPSFADNHVNANLMGNLTERALWRKLCEMRCYWRIVAP